MPSGLPWWHNRGSDSKESAYNAGTWVSMGQKDPLEKGMAPHTIIPDSMERGAWHATVHGIAKSQTQLSD